jgi:hypothetical protein
MPFSLVGNITQDLADRGIAPYNQKNWADTPTFEEQLSEAEWYENKDKKQPMRLVTASFPGGVITQEVDSGGRLDPSTQKAEQPEVVATRAGEELFPEGTTERLQEVKENNVPETNFEFETEISDLNIPGSSYGRIITSVVAGIIVLIIVYVAGQLFNINLG